MWNKSLSSAGNAGFTLIELMMVVAIIGILSAIAIPKYQKFVGRARQSEAKLALAGIYNAETSFQATGDSSSFSQCLASIGYTPAGYGMAGNKRYYSIVANFGATNDCGPAGTGECASTQWSASGATTAAGDCSGTLEGEWFFSANTSANDGPVPNYGSGCVSSACPGITKNTFTVSAYGFVSSKAGVDADTWQIDQNKVLNDFTPNNI